MRARAAKGLRREHSTQHGNSPARGYDHPAGVFGVCLAQAHAGVDAIAQQNQDKRPEKFAEPCGMDEFRFHGASFCRRTLASRCSEAVRDHVGAILGNLSILHIQRSLANRIAER